MTTSGPEPRTSIWSVPERWRRLYFAIFSIQIVGLIGLAVWYEVYLQTEDSWQATVFAISRDVGTSAVAVAAESIIVVDVVMILTLLVEDYLRKRHERDQATGAAQERERWEAWNQRRLEAEANNQPFTEPPPSPLFEEVVGK